MSVETTKVGRRGTVVLPAKLRRRLGLDEGALVVVEERDGGVLLRPAAARPVRIWTLEQKAEFLLNCAIGSDDYEDARVAVREMGLDPDKVQHEKPDVRRPHRKR
jgi:AbrB family looped-hinge helix DNA binding protein